MRGYLYERIDGNVRGTLRQTAIDRFSKPSESVHSHCMLGRFCFKFFLCVVSLLYDNLYILCRTVHQSSTIPLLLNSCLCHYIQSRIGSVQSHDRLCVVDKNGLCLMLHYRSSFGAL